MRRDPLHLLVCWYYYYIQLPLRYIGEELGLSPSQTYETGTYRPSDFWDAVFEKPWHSTYRYLPVETVFGNVECCREMEYTYIFLTDCSTTGSLVWVPSVTSGSYYADRKRCWRVADEELNKLRKIGADLQAAYREDTG